MDGHATASRIEAIMVVAVRAYLGPDALRPPPFHSFRRGHPPRKYYSTVPVKIFSKNHFKKLLLTLLVRG